jgi:hypothetical protein
MFDLQDFFDAIGLALRDLGCGESFWRSLAVYSGISVVIALIGLVIWRGWQ